MISIINNISFKFYIYGKCQCTLFPALRLNVVDSNVFLLICVL